MRVYYPDATEYRRALIGSMAHLCAWSAWERDARHGGREAAVLWKDALDMTLEAANESCEGVSVGEAEMSDILELFQTITDRLLELEENMMVTVTQTVNQGCCDCSGEATVGSTVEGVVIDVLDDGVVPEWVGDNIPIVNADLCRLANWIAGQVIYGLRLISSVGTVDVTVASLYVLITQLYNSPLGLMWGAVAILAMVYRVLNTMSGVTFAHFGEVANRLEDVQETFVCSLYSALSPLNMGVVVVSSVTTAIAEAVSDGVIELADGDSISTAIQEIFGAAMFNYIGDNAATIVPADYYPPFQCCTGLPVVWEHNHGSALDGCILTGIYSSCAAESEAYNTAQNGSASAYGYPTFATGEMNSIAVDIESSGVGSVVVGLMVDGDYYPVVTLTDGNARQDYIVAVPVAVSMVDVDLELAIHDGNGGGTFSYRIHRAWII